MDPGFASVKIYGTFEGVQSAKEFLAFEVNKVSPEASEEIKAAPGPMIPGATGDAVASASQLAPLNAPVVTPGTGPSAAEAAAAVPGVPRPWDAVVVPVSMVGWLKGRNGAMVREIQ